jgi:phosphatidate cytidylyltransferase
VSGAAATLCASELFRMFVRGARNLAGGVALAALVFLAGALLPVSAALPAVLLCVVLAVFHALPGPEEVGEKARTAAMLALGAVYVGGLLAMYPRTLFLPRGEHWVLLGILAVSAGDTLAYFTGRALGRTKLAPALSPNKTVEGAAGGLLGSVACSVLYAHGFLPGIPAWYAAAAGGAIGLFGQGGDLFESLLKRAAGVKDSGTLFPGHGGIFDRADGILAAGPVLYLLAAMSPLAGGGG